MSKKYNYIFTFLILILVMYVYIFTPQNKIETFNVKLISILLEAIPFVLIGTLASSLIQIFVTEEQISKILPKNTFVGIFVAASLGVIFPLCECTIVPVMRRLLKKGVPFEMALAFMLSTPIVNPVVLFSTYYAFNGDFNIMILRAGFGFIIAITSAVIMSLLVKGNINRGFFVQEHTHAKPKGLKELLISVFEHTSTEFYDIGKYLIFGTIISSFVQVFVSRDFLVSLSSNSLLSILVMMALAFILSICSEADAFIARSLSQSFPMSSILAFLVYGPMLDIKNVAMLMGSFKTKFVLKLIVVVTLLSATLMYFVSLLGI